MHAFHSHTYMYGQLGVSSRPRAACFWTVCGNQRPVPAHMRTYKPHRDRPFGIIPGAFLIEVTVLSILHPSKKCCRFSCNTHVFVSLVSCRISHVTCRQWYKCLQSLLRCGHSSSTMQFPSFLILSRFLSELRLCRHTAHPRFFLHFTFTTLVRRRFSLSEALRRLLPSFCRCITLHKGRPVLTALLTLISESQCCITLSLLPWQCPRLSQQLEKQLRELCPKWAVICSNLLALLLWAGARVRSNWVYI